MAQNTEKITIDILVNIIDNLGDMGFALELIIAMESREKGKYQFRLFTNNTSSLQGFFGLNKNLIGKYEIFEDSELLESNPSNLIFSLFHHPIPIFNDNKRRLILRFDYLSLDNHWISMNGVEHITSTEVTKIFEIIPSPLTGSAGLIQHKVEKIDKKTWIEKHDLPCGFINKKWFVIFAYGLTLERFDCSDIPDDIVILFAGKKNISNIYKKSDQIKYLDILSFDSYYSLLALSDMMIVRGEVSFVQALETGKPFFWDLYKEQGGFPEEMSEQFLQLGNFSDAYKNLHRELNTGKGVIRPMELWSFRNEKTPFITLGESARKRNIVDTIEKYVDSFDFSL